MLKNYFKVAFRNLLRNKGFSILNISGLAIGMASALLILLWVQNEWSYDSFYPNSDRLYQAWNKAKRGNDGIKCWNVTPKVLGPTLKQDYSEVEKIARMNWNEAILLTVGETKLNSTGSMVDPDFLTVFSLPFLKGDPNTALDQPDDIVITKKLSKELFGPEDAMGKVIRLDNKYNFRVSAVMKDLPNNTQFEFNYLLPWSFVRTRNEDDSSWDRNSTRNYILLKPHTDVAAFNKKIRKIIQQHAEPGATTEPFLYPVSRLRLYSSFDNNGQPSGGKIATVKVFLLVAAFILLIACINFMNMSTARSERRAKEVGIRKVVGAQKNGLIGQFIGESVLIAFIAGILALLIVQGCLPAFNTLTQKQLVIAYDSFYFWLSFVGFILFTGILAGSYPAFFLSSFRPVAVLKGTHGFRPRPSVAKQLGRWSFKSANTLITPRKVLVVLQFTFAITLIVCTIIIEQQVKYAQDRESGYDKNNLVYTFLAGDILKNYDLIKTDLVAKGIAVSVTKSSAPLTEQWASGGLDWPGKDPNDRTEFNHYFCDDGLVTTAGMQLVLGRDMDLKQYPTDSTAIILNETAVKVMHLKDPIGQVLPQGEEKFHIVGVVKDFILQSPYDAIMPMVIFGAKGGWFNLMHVKFNNAHTTAKNLAAMEKVFKQYNPNYPFEYHFIDELYAKKFSDEQTTGTLSAFFAGLTIFISCLGLFGLAAYMAENRIKEIGVRKVLGASVTSITALLSKDFIRLVFISILIASPIAWWAMDKWLAGYHYHIGISWWIFLAAGCSAILIALFTVSFQAIRAAVANPVRSLRSE
jgi:putative ABC transport system permease protein